jgi:hypothetical protein
MKIMYTATQDKNRTLNGEDNVSFVFRNEIIASVFMASVLLHISSTMIYHLSRVISGR